MIWSRIIGISSIVFGVFFLGIWIMIFLFKIIPEFYTRKFDIYFRMFVDFITISSSVSFGLVAIIYGKEFLYLTIISFFLVVITVFNCSEFIRSKIKKKKFTAFIILFDILIAATALLLIYLTMYCYQGNQCK